MELAGTQQWRWKFACAVVLMVFLSACSPPEQGRVVRDVAISPDGVAVEIDSGGYYETDEAAVDPQELVAVGQENEACLDDGACFRIRDHERIEQSSDNWVTSDVVWEISRTASWWNHEYDDGYNGTVIGLFDIVALPDQTVAVAAGQLPLIQRSADGEWTPTVASFRTLPTFSKFFGLLSVLVAVSAGLSFGNHYGAQTARVGLALTAPWLVLGGLYASGTATGLGAVLGLALLATFALVGLGVGAGSLARSQHTDGYLPRMLGVLGVTLASLLGFWGVVYWLWSSDRLAWSWALGMWLVSAVVGALVVGKMSHGHVVVDSGSRPISDSPVGLVGTVVLGWIAVTCTVLGVALIPLFVPVRVPMLGSVLAILLVLAAVGFVAHRTTRIPYESTAVRPHKDRYVFDS